MLLILISWIYILFTTINLGFGFDQLFHLKNKDFVVTAILGLFSVTVLASVWAIFGRIHIEFHVFLLLPNLALILKFNREIIQVYKAISLEIKQLKSSLKIILAFLTFLIIAQCACVPYVIDNESYYIQTIKWLNEYGFVKGLVNLHFFFGQMSGWHITQSAFNFSFLYKNFNDLSGFCLLLGTLFSIQKLNEFYKNNNFNYLLIGLLPLFNVFFFQFISAPSPDIPVYVFSFILFFYFLENFNETTSEKFNLILILVLFLLYIKNTTLTFALFPVILWFRNYKVLSKKLLKPVILCTIIFSIFILKNMIICGSPIFPSKILNSLTTNYAIPDSVESFYYDQVKLYGFMLSPEQYNSMSLPELVFHWLRMSKLNGLFNKIGFALLFIIPFFIYKFQNKKGYWVLYFIMTLQLFLLFITSPQYRFFMNFILFFSLFILISIIKNRKAIQTLLFLSLIPLVIVLFIPINLNRFSNHKFMLTISNFSTENIIFPFKNTKNDTTFKTIQLGNLTYNSPINNEFFWANGDGNLPCVNKRQLDYFEKYFGIIPQMRSNDLKDGFYAKQISKNE